VTTGKLALGEHRSTEENVAVLGGYRYRSHSPQVRPCLRSPRSWSRSSTARSPTQRSLEDTYATAASFRVAFAVWHTRSHRPQLT
jgi:hypothetical protein